jgi:hypothetical protein
MRFNILPKVKHLLNGKSEVKKGTSGYTKLQQALRGSCCGGKKKK